VIHLAVNSVKDLIFGLIGGSALLMYGINLMGEGLEKAAGRVIKRVVKALTGKLWTSFLAGTLITAAVQSSTAVTVLTVGLVNADLMGFKQAVGIIYGANIGTTITAQLMAFDITGLSLPAIGMGYILMTFSKNNVYKNLGQGILGFGMLFLGLRLINMGVPYLKKDALFNHFFRSCSGSVVISMLVGLLFTVIVQSSSAVMGITMILAGTGLIGLDGAIGLMLGSNIGTCATAQVAAISGNIASKRTALAHTLYNLIGAALTLLLIKPFIWIILYISPEMPIERLIANSHSVFNILSAVIFLPFTDLYVKLIEKIIPEQRKSYKSASKT
jgi:phosphate:Na+ symporter